MANTICLSTDMQTFYLITGLGATTSLSLSGNGVDVSISAGDVTAKAATKAPSGTETKFSTSKQFTAGFNTSASALEIIGITDTNMGRSFSFVGTNGINIRIAGAFLTVTTT